MEAVEKKEKKWGEKRKRKTFSFFFLRFGSLLLEARVLLHSPLSRRISVP